MSAVPASRPYAQTRPTLRVITRPRTNYGQLILAKTVLFTVIALGTSAAASLGGHVMVEKARHEGIRAIERARDASTAESAIRQRVTELTSFAALQDWAKAHNFQAPDALSTPFARRSLVALNR